MLQKVTGVVIFFQINFLVPVFVSIVLSNIILKCEAPEVVWHEQENDTITEQPAK